MTDLLNVGRVRRRRSAATSFLRTATGGHSGSYLELQQWRSFRPWTNKSSPLRVDNAWEVCDNVHVLQSCWLRLIRAHNVFKTFQTQIALDDSVNWRQWDACLMSNLSLSSVGIWRIILAQNQIINFVDFIRNMRSAWATAARGRSPINSTSIVDFTDQFLQTT